MAMNDLLRVAFNAHGRVSRWDQLKTVKVRLSITGNLASEGQARRAQRRQYRTRAA